MSENTQQAETAETTSGGVKLDSLYAYKEGMATVYNDKGEAIPVTILRYEPWKVSQIKTVANDGYDAVQIAGGGTLKLKNSDKAEMGHLKAAGFDTGVRHVREVRLEAAATVSVGDVISIDSLAKGDVVKITSKSKG